MRLRPARDKNTTAQTLDLMLGPVGTAMGAKLPELGRESTTYITRFFFAVRLFCLIGVTHGGNSRQNRRKRAPRWLGQYDQLSSPFST
jgi:hypothetical protein